MKEKIIAAVVIIALIIYLFVSFYHAHTKWQAGITMEEQIREDRMIW